jgi:hypothetical protein
LLSKRSRERDGQQASANQESEEPPVPGGSAVFVRMACQWCFHSGERRLAQDRETESRVFPDLLPALYFFPARAFDLRRMRFERFTRWGLAFVAALILISPRLAIAADFVLKITDKPAPKEVSEGIRAVLQSKAIQLIDGEKPALEIWPRAELPLKAKPASASDTLSALAETTLVGVVAVSEGGFRDYKDNDIPKGIYTARFGLQPQDGDHLGTAEFNYFLVLISADGDKELAGISQYKPMVKASGKLTSSGHPVIVSLRPAPSSETGTPKLAEPIAEHKAIRLKLPGKAGGGEKTDVALDVVYKGTGHIQ